ncbi:MAG: amidohydrolase family protein [Bacteroidia bacterium]
MPLREFWQTFFSLIFFVSGCLLACNPPKTQTQVDIAISNATILTMDSLSQVLYQATLLIKDGKIYAIGPDSILAQTYQSQEYLDAKGSLLLPGLINTHTHLPMTLLRGIADDLPLTDWLEKYIWPTEAALMDREAIRVGSQLAMAELIRSGTTCFNDMYFYADEIASVAEEAGMLGRVGEGLLDYPPPSYPDAASALKATRALAATYRSHPRI